MPNEKALVGITIDGVQVSVPAGFTILAAARKAGIHIPTLCYLKDVSDIGMCRVCSVEVEGRDNLVAACKELVQDGMVVLTNTERATAYRKMMLVPSETRPSISPTSQRPAFVPCTNARVALS